MEEALYEITSMRKFAGLSLAAPIPDETTIPNLRHLLETNDLAPEILSRINAYLTRKGLMLKRGSIVDATIMSAPSSTKNASGERDPEMHQAKKGEQGYFGMKVHIGVDVDSRLVHARSDSEPRHTGSMEHRPTPDHVEGQIVAQKAAANCVG